MEMCEQLILCRQQRLAEQQECPAMIQMLLLGRHWNALEPVVIVPDIGKQRQSHESIRIVAVIVAVAVLHHRADSGRTCC